MSDRGTWREARMLCVPVAMVVAVILIGWMSRNPDAPRDNWLSKCAQHRPLTECETDYERLK